MSLIEIKKLSPEEIEERGIYNWSIWEKEVSRFDWYYDNTEECLLIEGEVEITTPEGIFRIEAGDFVIFKEGLKCNWNIKQPVRKYFFFPE